ncbi:conserved hypothetical protein [Phycicoccus elongatus Lp2]|uniref:Imm-5-like domain-containing protein n=1 Tax=Phycicoccus elongatus Lp2 TaxID=1193181 RepID=N0E3X3_9MICO|nr:conserved hypothetical protein [Phycicoccus elongatus Lp2]
MAQHSGTVPGDFDLTIGELRTVVRYVVMHAEDVLDVFEQAVPDDPRPRAAIEAAWTFVNGANRTKLQRVASLDAHRAARSAPSEAARLAAQSAGDAASAAYLHPIAQASQVGHILRAAANAAHIAELTAGGDPTLGDALLNRSRQRATAVLSDVLRRYPHPPRGRSRVSQLIHALDQSLRQSDGADPGRAQLAKDRPRTKTPGALTLSENDRRILALWAADCAERTLPLFLAEAPDDPRPREAIEGAGGWTHTGGWRDTTGWRTCSCSTSSPTWRTSATQGRRTGRWRTACWQMRRRGSSTGRRPISSARLPRR